MSIEQTLNGGYSGLYGEVVTSDIYKVRTVADIVSCNDPNFVHVAGHSGIDFVPDVVFDLGANIGIFSRYARSLWPNCKVISVEPDPSNIEVFKQYTSDSNITLLEKAIGKDELWHFFGAVNGSGESYASPGIGYPRQFMGRANAIRSIIPMVMPDELVGKYVQEGQKFLVKMDIEGAENCVFEHGPSMDALRRADYFCAEIHFYGLVHRAELRREIMDVLNTFHETHHCSLEHVNFYARKK